MKKEKSIFVKAGYLLGIIFCLVASVSLVYASYMMVSWTFSEHPDIVYSDYSNSYDYYEYETSGQDSDTISDSIDGETIIFQELGFENYAGLVEVSYNLNVPSDNNPNGLEVYFVKSVNGYYQFVNSYESIVTDYKSCQKKDVMDTSGSCTIQNGGGIMIYNTANKPRSFTLSFTIKYDPSLIESS
jgi:hypothetical protein